MARRCGVQVAIETIPCSLKTKNILEILPGEYLIGGGEGGGKTLSCRSIRFFLDMK